jgi:N-methylhydantoinase A
MDSDSTSLPEVAIGVDVGGTFTDVVIINAATRELRVDKVLSTPAQPAIGVMNGLRKVLGEERRLVESLRNARVVHATTIATNALIESKTARVALITNRGFRDVLEIRRHYRTNLYDMFMSTPAPLVPRELRLELDCRMDFRGEILEPVDTAQVVALMHKLRAEGVEACAICLLHSYAAPEQEERIAEIGREIHPEAVYTCSSSVCPEYREYERTSTTVVNAAVMPLVDRYLSELEGQLRDSGYARELYIMQSNGGMMMSTQIRRTPVNIIESGPAAGVVAAAAIGQLTGRPNLISFDMGGTTAKAALVHDGHIALTNEYEVGGGGHGAEKQEGYAIRVPVMEIAEVGAGGGSIAWIDVGGALRVGPTSAGADPGPVCYGNGGTSPTTTDANLVLGRLGADYFLGGEMPLDIAGARRAIESAVARPLNLDLIAAAAGIIDVSNSHMVRALRRVSVEKGRHPRDYTLVAFGGAGPLQAADLADELGVQEIIVPPYPGVASALGMLGSDIRQEYQRAFFGVLESVDAQAVCAVLRALSNKASEDMSRSGVPARAMRLVASADLRYFGQAYEIRIDWPTLEPTAAELHDMTGRFHAEHQLLYSFSTPSRAVEIASLRVTAIGRVAKLNAAGPGKRSGMPRPKAHRAVHFRQAGIVECAVFERSHLREGQSMQGPAIIEQKDSTTVVPPNWTATTDAHGHLIISKSAIPATN